jgi:hypothetical protein
MDGLGIVDSGRAAPTLKVMLETSKEGAAAKWTLRSPQMRRSG